MTELRVALFTGNYNHIKDGVSLTLNRLVKYLESQNIPVLVFGPSIENPVIDHNGELVVTPSIPMVVSGRDEYRIALRFPDYARERLEEFKPTLVHVATPDGLGYKALKWAQQNQVQLVSSYHTHFTSYFQYYGLEPIEFFAWRYFNWFYSQCTHTYVPSQSMIDELADHGIDKGMKVWARGVNTALFSPEKRDMDFRRSVGFKDDETVVTFVSRLVWEKELRTFVESVKNVQAKNPKVRAMIVGDGPARAEVEELLPEAHFTGFVNGEELARAYASSDVFLFPSHTETFGNVTLEAMASGLPCLVADAIGSKSLVDDGVNGRWAKKQSIRDFTDKLEWIIADKDRMKELGEASRRMSLNYEWDKINAGLVKNYREALSMPKPQLKF
ncbi:glycosyltransferase family 4 protein [Balneola vulgaris]|uniref:glycosyltransferase family 4 protein n=1 Tax=Balneola vulgaris TaxID=287535 RepID=UPI00037E4108|nr:glycosyltransferase family 1 protein [Balneola vulgaris]